MRILYCNKYDYPFSGTEAYLFDDLGPRRLTHGRSLVAVLLAVLVAGCICPAQTAPKPESGKPTAQAALKPKPAKPTAHAAPEPKADANSEALYAKIETGLAGIRTGLAELQRMQAQRGLIILWEKTCLAGQLSDEQKDYVETLTEYSAQHYLLAVGEIDSSGCKLRYLNACERVYPGQCVSVPGEINGRRP